MAATVERLSEHIGAEIRGVDVSEPLDDATYKTILNAFHEHMVVVFRGQSLTPEQHIAFSRRFGELAIHVSSHYLLPGYPELLLLTNERKESGERVSIADGGGGWHSDLSYEAKPSMGSVLYAVRTPDDPSTTQDTEWSNQYLAYDTLPDDIKRRISGLKAIHIFDQEQNPRMGQVDTRYRDRHTPELRAKTPPRTHPMVRTHPDTRRKALYVSLRFSPFIAEIDPDEGAALLDRIFEHQEDDRFRFRYRWNKGDVVMWDNRCTIHRAAGKVAEPPNIRRLHRTTIAGDVPF